MPRIQEPKKGHLIITIPQQIAKALSWKKGTELVFNYEENFVTLKKVKSSRFNKKSDSHG